MSEGDRCRTSLGRDSLIERIVPHVLKTTKSPSFLPVSHHPKKLPFVPLLSPNRTNQTENEKRQCKQDKVHLGPKNPHPRSVLKHHPRRLRTKARPQNRTRLAQKIIQDQIFLNEGKIIHVHNQGAGERADSARGGRGVQVRGPWSGSSKGPQDRIDRFSGVWGCQGNQSLFTISPRHIISQPSPPNFASPLSTSSPCSFVSLFSLVSHSTTRSLMSHPR
jgi:hypothetical protein